VRALTRAGAVVALSTGLALSAVAATAGEGDPEWTLYIREASGQGESATFHPKDLTREVCIKLGRAFERSSGRFDTYRAHCTNFVTGETVMEVVDGE
jgi:hypothetical protein